MTEEQQDQEQQEIAEEEKVDAEAAAPAAEETAASGKKRGKRKTKLVNEADVMPRPSYWPFALAVAMAVMLIGVMLHPAVFILGVILVIGAIIGWALERR